MSNQTKKNKAPKYHDYDEKLGKYIPKKIYKFKTHPSQPDTKLVPRGHHDELMKTEEGRKFFKEEFEDNKKWKYMLLTVQEIRKLINNPHNKTAKNNSKTKDSVGVKKPLRRKLIILPDDDENNQDEILTDPEKKAESTSTKKSIEKYIDLLYPNVGEEQFNEKLIQHKEFNDSKFDGTIKNIVEESDRLCASDFELMPHQNFVRNFINFNTPYNSLLLYHGLGTGKTCSAIGVAEEMRKSMKQMDMRKSIIVIASPNVQDNFRLQLFDENKLVETNGLWNIRGCVGNSLLNEINPSKIQNMPRHKVVSQIKSLINKYYVFMGYTQFSNFVTNKIDSIMTSNIEDKKKQKIKKIKTLFDNRLIIIDEVHNIRITNDNTNKKTAEVLFDIVQHSQNMRLLLMSATPMYNSHEEIIWITNLMNLNDKKSILKIGDVFDKKGDFKKGKGNENGKELLRRKLLGYVSYVRGENPYTFPVRVYASKKDYDSDFAWELPTIQMNNKKITKNMLHIQNQIFLNTIGSYQKHVYEFIIQSMKKDRLLSIESDKGNAFESMDSFGYSLLQKPIESLNIVYPNDAFDEKMKYKSGDDSLIQTMTGKNGLNSIMKFKEIKSDEPIKYDFEYKDTKYGKIFSPQELHKYSCKMASVCETIKQSKGIIMIYSQYIDGGAVPMALALEEMGFTRFGTAGYTKSLLKSPPQPIDSMTMKVRSDHVGEFRPARYMMITGDKIYSPDNNADIKYLNDASNKRGEKVKVVIITKAAAEGVDFKNIRQLHILEPWYNLNRIEQIVGRSVRNLSHCNLPFKERNVEIFLHATTSESNIETTDVYLYRLAERKSIKIGKVTRLMKETAVDCVLNIGQTNFTAENMKSMENGNIECEMPNGTMRMVAFGDKPYTDICDYMDNCAFKCSVKKNKNTDETILKTTYANHHMMTNQDALLKRIRDLFKDIPGYSRGRFFFKKDELINAINIVKTYPVEQIFNALTYLINNNSEYLVDKYGRLGRLVNKGEYYLFQPQEITDLNASTYQRITPVYYRHRHITIDVPEMTVKSLDKQLHGKQCEKIIKNASHMYDIAHKKHSFDSNEKDWYKNFYSLTDHVQKVHKMDDSMLNYYLVSHIVENMSLHDKICLLNFLGTKTSYTSFEKVLKQYFDSKTIINNDMTNPFMGVPLAVNGKVVEYYGEKGDVNTKWEKLEFTDVRSLIMSSEYNAKYVVPKRDLNDIIGFTTYMRENEYVFKLRDLNDSVNTKGARVEQAQKKDILMKLNDAIGSQVYNLERIDNKIQIVYGPEKTVFSKNQIIVLTELMFRHYDNVQKNGKRWNLTNEDIVINKIHEYKKLN